MKKHCIQFCFLLFYFSSFAGPDQDIHAATSANDLAGVKKALAAGANVNALGTQNNTPLHVAAYYAYSDIALTLIENKADVNAKKFSEHDPFNGMRKQTEI